MHTPGSSMRLKLALDVAGQHVCEIAQEGAIVCGELPWGPVHDTPVQGGPATSFSDCNRSWRLVCRGAALRHMEGHQQASHEAATVRHTLGRPVPCWGLQRCRRALESTLTRFRRQQCRESLSSARHSQGSQGLPFLGRQCHASIEAHAGPGSHQRAHPEPAQLRVLLSRLWRAAQSSLFPALDESLSGNAGLLDLLMGL